MMHHRKRRLTLADVIKVVSQFSRDDHEMSVVVADMINRNLIKLRVPHKRAKIVP